jgi:predicted DNA-binding protein (UPF0251 family)
MPKKRDGLRPKQVEAIGLMIDEGLNYTDTCKALNMNRSTLWEWFEDTTFSNEYNKALRKKINAIGSSAIQIIDDLAKNAQSEAVRIQAAKDLADRSGWKPVEVVQTTGETVIEVKITHSEDE